MKEETGLVRNTMRPRTLNPMRRWGVVFLGLTGITAAYAAERFEAAALVDSFDFACIEDRKGGHLFDTETAQGNVALLDHVLLTGANTILWRNCSGATLRYQSKEEYTPWVQTPLDKRRLPDSRPVYGWLRYNEAEPDILRHILGVCHVRGLRAGVHWPFEETHWASWTFGAWNFEHPQYWGVTAKGQIWAGRCSLAYPEVVAHKLRLADELLERGTDHLFIDTWRIGGWSPAYEYVAPERARWKARYGCEPPQDPMDPRWCAFVSETTHAGFVALRKRLDASGRKVRLMVGIPEADVASGKPDVTLLTRGVDWQRLVREDVIDTLVVMNVNWDVSRPFESTREIYRGVLTICSGHCEVLFPVSEYNYSRKGIPEYQKAARLPPGKIAVELLKIAWEEGADGICMECVDYNNYPAETRAELRAVLEGACRFKRDPR